MYERRGSDLLKSSRQPVGKIAVFLETLAKFIMMGIAITDWTPTTTSLTGGSLNVIFTPYLGCGPYWLHRLSV